MKQTSVSMLGVQRPLLIYRVYARLTSSLFLAASAAVTLKMHSFPVFDQYKEIIGSLVDLIAYLIIIKSPLGFCISSSSCRHSSVRTLTLGLQS